MASVLLPAQPGLGKTSWAQSTRPTGQRLAVRRPWQPTGPGWQNIGLDQASRGRAASPATCALGPRGMSWGWGQQGGHRAHTLPNSALRAHSSLAEALGGTEDSRSSLDKGIGFPLHRRVCVCRGSRETGASAATYEWASRPSVGHPQECVSAVSVDRCCLWPEPDKPEVPERGCPEAAPTQAWMEQVADCPSAGDTQSCALPWPPAPPRRGGPSPSSLRGDLLEDTVCSGSVPSLNTLHTLLMSPGVPSQVSQAQGMGASGPVSGKTRREPAARRGVSARISVTGGFAVLELRD